MAMDARWKVYVQDRRFDDNQISNMYLKLKWETVGRFSFDFRPMDGDESYMVANNTLRIFWGDLHKLDGVIQRVDWDATQWCYHIYGADIRGLLLERVNTEPATVHSYTSDVQTQVMFNGCNFPTNVWTGSGDQIGKYTFKYRVGIQNTMRVLPDAQYETVVERGTVSGFVGRCIQDITKGWTVDQYKNNTVRFISGACKNRVYKIRSNSANTVCIEAVDRDVIYIDGYPYGNVLYNTGFEEPIVIPPYNGIPYPNRDGFDNWVYAPWDYEMQFVTPGHDSSTAACPPGGNLFLDSLYQWPTDSYQYEGYEANLRPIYIKFYIKPVVGELGRVEDDWVVWVHGSVYYPLTVTATTPQTDGWYCIEGTYDPPAGGGCVVIGSLGGSKYVDDVSLYIPGVTGRVVEVPPCVSIGDVFEIVTSQMTQRSPSPVVPATLEKDNHIIHYNTTDDQSDHTTSMTVRGNA